MAFGLNLSHVDPLTAVVFLVLTVAAVSPLGVLAAALAMVIKKTGPVEWMSVSSADLFGGVYVPLASMPVCAAGHRLVPADHARAQRFPRRGGRRSARAGRAGRDLAARSRRSS